MIVQITTPSRLHFGLIDLNGELGRINGSLGVALENPSWLIHAGESVSPNDTILSEEFKKQFSSFKARFDQQFKTNSKQINFSFVKDIPAHVGLGSKTQFFLGIGALLAKIHHLDLEARPLAKLAERGGTSGIGVAAFTAGGFIVDGGHSFGPGKTTTTFQPSSTSKAPPPPVLFQTPLPASWRFLIITPKGFKGFFGSKEQQLFTECCPVPAREPEQLSRLILMKILPALKEADIQTFGAGLTELQTKFKRFGFEKYSGTIVAELLELVRKQDFIFGSGISSFGPTIFGLTNALKKVSRFLEELAQTFSPKRFEILKVTTCNTTGAKINFLKV